MTGSVTGGPSPGAATAPTWWGVERRDLLAELVGTFVLVITGSLALARFGLDSPAAVLAVATAFALGLAAALAAVGPDRLRRVNPGLTLAATLEGGARVAELVLSTVAQVIGAVTASAVVGVVLGSDAVARTATESPDVVEGLVTETTFGAIFALVYLVTTADLASLAAARVAMVLAYGAIHVAALPISGASVNPARTLGPAIVSGTYGDVWIYLVAPVIGAGLAVGVHSLTRPP